MLSIISIFPHTLSFPILFPSTSTMCFQTIPVFSQTRSNITRRRQRNPANLRPISTSSTTPLSFSMGLWNCQSAVNKADLISAFCLRSTLSILGLTETWIRPEDSATPAALSNIFFLSTFFYLFLHKTSQHNIHSNKQNRHILNILKVQSKGRERGREKEKTKQVIPLYNHVC